MQSVSSRRVLKPKINQRNKQRLQRYPECTDVRQKVQKRNREENNDDCVSYQSRSVMRVLDNCQNPEMKRPRKCIQKCATLSRANSTKTVVPLSRKKSFRPNSDIESKTANRMSCSSLLSQALRNQHGRHCRQLLNVCAMA